MKKQTVFALITTAAIVITATAVLAADDKNVPGQRKYRCVETDTRAAAIEDKLNELAKAGWHFATQIVRPSGMKVKTIICVEK